MSKTEKTLRETFTDVEGEKAARETAAAFQATDKALCDLADNLEARIKKEIEAGRVNRLFPQDPSVSFILPVLNGNEVKKMSGYKKLHEACKGDDVQVDLGMLAQYANNVIVIRYTRPYASSSDAPKPKKRNLLKRVTGR